MAIVVDPLQLYFPSPHQRAISNVITVTNNTATAVIFKLRAVTPERYSVKPKIDLLSPGASVRILITMSPLAEDVDPTKFRDGFQIDFAAPASSGSSDLKVAWNSATPLAKKVFLQCNFTLPADRIPSNARVDFPAMFPTPPRANASVSPAGTATSAPPPLAASAPTQPASPTVAVVAGSQRGAAASSAPAFNAGSAASQASFGASIDIRGAAPTVAPTTVANPVVATATVTPREATTAPANSDASRPVGEVPKQVSPLASATPATARQQQQQTDTAAAIAHTAARDAKAAETRAKDELAAVRSAIATTKTEIDAAEKEALEHQHRAGELSSSLAAASTDEGAVLEYEKGRVPLAIVVLWMIVAYVAGIILRPWVQSYFASPTTPNVPPEADVLLP